MLDLAVLVSGNGSNLQAILDAIATGSLGARVRLVASNKATAFGLERARRASVPTLVLEPGTYPDRSSYDEDLARHLRDHGAEWVVLAGFMRVLSPTFLRAFPGRVLNIHPGLLPSFPGLHAPRQALAHGVKLAGCTVHFVDEGVDTGPIIAQTAVPVVADDTEETLHARIRREERRLYPAVLQALSEARLRVEGRRVHIDGSGPHSGRLSSLPLQEG